MYAFCCGRLCLTSGKKVGGFALQRSIFLGPPARCARLGFYPSPPILLGAWMERLVLLGENVSLQTGRTVANVLQLILNCRAVERVVASAYDLLAALSVLVLAVVVVVVVALRLAALAASPSAEIRCTRS